MLETVILYFMIAMGIWAIGFLIYFSWLFSSKGHTRIAEEYHNEIAPAVLIELLLSPSSLPTKIRDTLMRHPLGTVTARLAEALEVLAPDKQEAADAALTAAGFELSIGETQMASFGLEGHDAPRLRCALLYPPNRHRQGKWLDPGLVQLRSDTLLTNNIPKPREGFLIDFADWTFPDGYEDAYGISRQ